MATKVVTIFLALVLTLNNFVFNCKYYLQIKGSAMGMVCAPSYANIFMDHYVYSFLQAHNSIKFEYEISQTNITFLDTKVSIQNNKFVTKIYQKSIDHQNFFHIDSGHPNSPKDSIPYCHALRINRIFTTPNEEV